MFMHSLYIHNGVSYILDLSKNYFEEIKWYVFISAFRDRLYHFSSLNDKFRRNFISLAISDADGIDSSIALTVS